MQAGLKNYSATIFVGWQNTEGVAEHQQFRKRLFVDRLGWTLTHHGGLEFDEFDTKRAIYCLVYRDRKPVGGWRALTTADDYLSQAVFPELAPQGDYPSNPDIWEISRLGILPHRDGALSARLVYGLMVHFAISRDVSSLIGVVDVAHARNMAIAGLSIRPCNEPVAVGINRAGIPIRAFLAEMRPEEQHGTRFEKIMSLLEQMEIRDEARLLGPERISA